MSNMIIDHSVNVIGMNKDNTNYVMCCAWSMMCDYDKLLCLLGAQSVTGNKIKKGDIIGFNALEKNQIDIANVIGDSHSDKVDKLKSISYKLDDTAIIIDNAKVNCKCEVIDVLHLNEIEVDNLLYLRVLSFTENEGEFLHTKDM